MKKQIINELKAINTEIETQIATLEGYSDDKGMSMALVGLQLIVVGMHITDTLTKMQSHLTGKLEKTEDKTPKELVEELLSKLERRKK